MVAGKYRLHRRERGGDIPAHGGGDQIARHLRRELGNLVDRGNPGFRIGVVDQVFDHGAALSCSRPGRAAPHHSSPALISSR